MNMDMGTNMQISIRRRAWDQLAACSLQPVAVVTHHHLRLVGAVIRAVCHNLCF